MLNHNLLNVYNHLPISFTHGKGVWLFDEHGNRYLDLICGLGVTILGHNHPVITTKICEQATKLIHSSNMVTIPQQTTLANMLVKFTGITTTETTAKVFFNNSGSEAVETALKLVRLYGHHKNIYDPKIIIIERAFHGRTIATLSASDNPDIQRGFEPLLDCFIKLPFNDLSALNELNNSEQSSNIVAILLEPVQGEGGIRIHDYSYLKAIRNLCSKNNWLLICDEIQSGIGRTGKLFCYQNFDIIPDVITVAKGLANGIPIGACIIKNYLAELFKPKSHGSTFGGNQLACSTAIATLEEITKHKLDEQAAANGAYFLQQLHQKLANNPHVIAIRGLGLMIGIELDIPCQQIVPIAIQHGLFLNVTRQYIIRLLPPLIIEKSHIDLAVNKIKIILDLLHY